MNPQGPTGPPGPAEPPQSATLSAAGGCPHCSDPATTGDTYCEACGRRLDGLSPENGPAPANDHVEVDVGAAAGVSDRGLRHSRNEDAMAVLTPDGPEPTVLAVVCDGVSVAPRSAEASGAAARTGAAVLADEIKAGRAVGEATTEALARADAAVSALAGPEGPAPACTYVSAVVPQGGAPGGEVTIGWSGDSRAYWLAGAADASPSALLTRDDSWGEAMVSMRAMTPEQARASAHAHTLTAWLGASASNGAVADPSTTAAGGHIATVAPGGPGAVVLCTDGLWNYLPEPAGLAEAVPRAGERPVQAARELVRIALDSGGRDNVTVVVVGVPMGPD